METLIRWTLALALVAGVIFGVVKAYDHWHDSIRTEGKAEGLREGRAEVQKKWDDARAQAQAQAVENHRLAALETERRLNQQQENDRAQQAQLARARADADRARAAADGLQLRAAAYLNAAGCGTASGDSAIACIREAAAKVADALGRCGAIARAVAADADDARARGQLCEMNYDALTLKPSTP